MSSCVHSLLLLIHLETDCCVGFALLKFGDDPLAYLARVSIHPSNRSCGLGTILLDTAVSYCSDRDYEGLYLWASPEAVDFYKSLDFQHFTDYGLLGIAPEEVSLAKHCKLFVSH